MPALEIFQDTCKNPCRRPWDHARARTLVLEEIDDGVDQQSCVSLNDFGARTLCLEQIGDAVLEEVDDDFDQQSCVGLDVFGARTLCLEEICDAVLEAVDDDDDQLNCVSLADSVHAHFVWNKLAMLLLWHTCVNPHDCAALTHVHEHVAAYAVVASARDSNCFLKTADY